MKVTYAHDMVMRRDRHVIAANRIYHRENFNHHVTAYINNRHIVSQSALPLGDWYTEEACKLFRVMDYSELIQSDLNSAAHPKGYHIILECDYVDLNPFNMGSNNGNNRFYYQIDKIVDLVRVRDTELCEVMSI